MGKHGAFALCIGVFLAGCSASGVAPDDGGSSGGGTANDGGGGGTNEDPTPVTFDVPDYGSAPDIILAADEALLRVVDLGPTRDSDVPVRGSARFSGPILIDDQSERAIDASVLGGMELRVTFANANNISGEARNFYDLNDDPVDGTLTVSNAAFAEVNGERGFRMDLDGRLRGVGESDDIADWDYDLRVFQTFAGDGVTGLLGAGAGEALRVGGSNPHDVFVTTVGERR